MALSQKQMIHFLRPVARQIQYWLNRMRAYFMIPSLSVAVDVTSKRCVLSIVEADSFDIDAFSFNSKWAIFSICHSQYMKAGAATNAPQLG